MTQESVVIAVTPDGAGNSMSFAEAWDHAVPGAVLQLAAGTYVLERSLEVPHALRIEGDGVSSTRLVCAGEEFAIRCLGEGSLQLADLTIVHEGDAWANVVEIWSGEAHIKQCAFSGGALADDGSAGGIGLLLSGEATGLVEGCIAHGNATVGICVSGAANITLQGNTCARNGSTGLVLESATSSATENTCSLNTIYGIAVTKSATPSLSGNTCNQNGYNGIVYCDDAGGTANGNTCNENEGSGTVVRGQSRPTLERNICKSNGQDGISYCDDAHGTATANDCSENKADGVSVSDESCPELTENTCTGNLNNGMSFQNGTSGTVEKNTCRGNHGNGIAIAKRAAPTVKENVCEANLGHGIAVRDIAVPRLRQNTCRGNKGSGIAFYDSAAGFADGNTCEKNAVFGIVTKDRSQPALDMNFCSIAGIMIEASSWPTIYQTVGPLKKAEKHWDADACGYTFYVPQPLIEVFDRFETFMVAKRDQLGLTSAFRTGPPTVSPSGELVEAAYEWVLERSEPVTPIGWMNTTLVKANRGVQFGQGKFEPPTTARVAYHFIFRCAMAVYRPHGVLVVTSLTEVIDAEGTAFNHANFSAPSALGNFKGMGPELRQALG